MIPSRILNMITRLMWYQRNQQILQSTLDSFRVVFILSVEKWSILHQLRYTTGLKNSRLFFIQSKVCMCVCIRNWPLPIGAFQDHCKQTIVNKHSNKHNQVKNPTGRRYTSWLFTSVSEKMNSGYRERHRLAVRTGFVALTTLPRCLPPNTSTRFPALRVRNM